MNPANEKSQPAPASGSGASNSMPGSNNPKLSSVNYVTILPEGKTSGYKPQQQIDYKIDPIQFPYIDGKQSYLLLNVTPEVKFSNTSATAKPGVCFPANMGANSLVNRLVCRSNDGTGRILEDREAYNLYNGIGNAYQHDSDVFPALAKVEAVSGRSTATINQSIDNINNCYFFPQADIATTSNESVHGNTLIQNSFVIPIQLGLFSAFSDQHFALPNMDINGVHLTYHLETGNRTMMLLCHKFYKKDTLNNGVANCHVEHAVNPLTKIACTFSSGTEFKIDQSVCNCDLVINGRPWDLSFLAWRVGHSLEIGSNNNQALITKIEIDGGQVKVTLGNAVVGGGGGADTIGFSAIGDRDYTIDKCELRVLNTMPDMPTMKQIRRAVMNGVNYNTTQLYKVSTASQLKNAVIDIPESLTKVMSLMVVPLQQANLNVVDQDNVYLFSRPDSILANNDNDYEYQFQVRDVLIPNLAVVTDKSVDDKNDNCIYFNNQMMALRPMMNVRALTDHAIQRENNTLDLTLPYFFPLLLSPQGSSFDLIDSAPQLRITNRTTTVADITAKLNFVFANHTRLLRITDQGVNVEF
tara:strand:- start:9891 stop:11639 length:1749 start_codon:yes stop_codon:yes gene_type:complete